MTVSMDMIKDLRQRTGAGIMECKEALKASDNNMEGAADYLRKKGITKAAKKADRNTKEGAVRAVVKGGVAAMIEAKCETDFVARNDKFQNFVAGLAEHLLAASEVASDEEFLSQPFVGGASGMVVRDVITNSVTELGENIVLGRRAKVALEGPGLLTSYIHGVGNIGVLVRLDTDSSQTAEKPEVAELGRDLAMQIAAMKPIALRQDQIPQETIDKEKEIFAAQARESGKPENIIPKIVEGSVKKFLAESLLPMQAFVKDNKKTVDAVVKEVAAKAGGKIEVKSFIRYELGE